MARERSDKGKNKPLDKSSNKKKTTKVGQSDKGGPTNAEPTAETFVSHHSLHSVAKPKQSQERQQMQELSVDSRESEQFSAEMFSMTARNGYQGVVEDHATHQRIAERAFILFQKDGCEHGNDWAHWFEAERQIKEIQT